jgi:hypothetical protein
MINRVWIGRDRSRGGSQRYLKLKQPRRPPVESLNEVRTVIDDERSMHRSLMDLSCSALDSLPVDKRPHMHKSYSV